MLSFTHLQCTRLAAYPAQPVTLVAERHPSHAVGFSGLQEGAARPEPAHSIIQRNFTGRFHLTCNRDGGTASLHIIRDTRNERTEFKIFETATPTTPVNTEILGHRSAGRGGLPSEQSTAAYFIFSLVHSGVSCI